MTRVMRKSKRALSLLLVFGLLTSLLCLPAAAADDPLSGLSGSGTQRDPYLIGNPEELEVFRDYVNSAEGTQNFAYWRQTADIDLSGVDNWTPIGQMVSSGIGSDIYRFSGEYDGDGYSITNMTIRSSGAEAVGLFGNISRATIRDLTVTGSITHTNAASHSANYGVGGIVGQAIALYDPDITNPDSSCSLIGCVSKVDISASSMVGGVCGATQTDTRFENCSYEGSIILSMTSQYSYDVYGTGGICGISQGYDDFIGCVNRGSITCTKGDVSLGGIVGFTSNGAVTAIESCYNTGAISCAATSGSTGVGGIVGKRANGYGSDAGEAMKMSIRSCYNIGQLTAADGGTTGGIVGRCVSAAVDGSAIWTEENLSHVYALKGTADYIVRGVTNDGKIRNSPGESDTAEILRYMEDIAEELGEAFISEDDSLILPWEASTARYNVTFIGYDGLTGETIPVRVDLDYEYGLAPGRYTYTASKNGYNNVTGSFGIVSSDKTIYVTLEPSSYTYTLTVVPANAVVVLESELGAVEPEEKTVSDGKAVYVYNLNSNVYGDYTRSISAYGYEPRTDTLEVAQSTAQSIALTPAQVYAVTIAVEDANGSAVEPQELSVTDTRFGVSLAPEDGGGYLLPDGEYTVTVRAGGYKQTRQTFAVSGADLELTVTLTDDVWAGEINTAWYSPDAARYELYTTAELAGLAALVNGGTSFAGKTVALCSDLELGGTAWTPIGSSTVNSFQGTFDGQGHTIGGLRLNTPEVLFDDYYEKYKLAWPGHMGLFGYVSGAVIENLTIDAVSQEVDLDWYQENYDLIAGANSLSFVGNVAAHAVGTTFRGVSTRGVLHTQGNYIGGLVGEAKRCAFVSCENRADVSGAYSVGGVAGQADGASTFYAVANYGAVRGYFSLYMANKTGHGVGGILGGSSTAAAVALEACANLGAVSGNSMLGGLVGAGNAKLLDCYNGAAVTITDDEVTVTAATVDDEGNAVDAVMGVQDGLYAGGLLGYAASLTAENCYNRAAVTDNSGVDCAVGALVGMAGEADVTNSYYFDPAGSDVYGTPVPETERTQLAEKLGTAYGEDTAGINGGYPVLTWQKDGSFYTVRFPVSYDTGANAGRELTVTVNGAPITGTRAELPGGSYTYTVTQDGYETVCGSFTVVGKDVTVPVSMTAVKYTYIFTTDANVAVRGGDTLLEPQSTDGGVCVYALYNGTYEYIASKNNHVTEKGEIVINFAGGEKTIVLESAPVYSVSFDVSLDGAAFYDWTAMITDADGCDYGSVMAGGALALMDGTYRYTLTALGCEEANGEFTVENGQTTVRVDMKRKTAAVWHGGVDTGWYSAASDAYYIYTAEELAGLAALVNEGASFAGKSVYLMNDLDLGGEDWTAIGFYGKAFSGTFDGNGHTITGSGNYVAADSASTGLFGYTKDAKIKNLVLAGARTVTASYASAAYNAGFGGLIGWADKTAVEHVANRMDLSLSVTGAAVLFVYAGGLVGRTDAAQLTGCNNIGDISVCASSSGSSTVLIYAGGLAGQFSGGMAGCYNSGRITADCPYMSRIGGLAGAVSGTGTLTGNYAVGETISLTANTAYISALFGGNYSADETNYYLASLPCTGGTAKTAEQMQAESFAQTLGEHFRYIPGTYPMNDWETAATALSVSRLPDKVVYHDLECFDDTGLELTVTYAGGAQAAVTGGWVVINGDSLAVGQTEVIVTYLGKRAAVPVTVTQVTHELTPDALELSLAAPQVGETGAQAALTPQQKQLFDASVTWMRSGQPFDGVFAPNTYYYASVKLTISQRTDTLYAFAADARPTVAGAYEILNVDVDASGTAMTFLVTYRISDTLTDKAGHLYYDGIDAARAALLDETVSVTLNGAACAAYTVRELETMALAGSGVEKNGFTGLPLYALLNRDGAMNLLADTGTVTLGGQTLTLAQLRGDAEILLAYGRNGDVLDAMTLTTGGAVTEIAVCAQSAPSFTAVFRSGDAAASGSVLTICDSFGNPVYEGGLGSVSLRQGETYRYRVETPGYAAQTGLVSEAGIVTVTLVPQWNGTYRAPAVDENGFYLIGTAEELAWFHQQCTGVSLERSKEMCSASVKLLADVSMKGYDWTPIAPTESARTLYYPNGVQVYCGGQYSGVFDGQGHTIYDVNVSWDKGVDNTGSRMDAYGLFGYLRGAVVRDLGVRITIDVEDACDMAGDWLAVGGIAGFAQTGALISGCFADADITVAVKSDSPAAAIYTGGIVGTISSPLYQSVVENCYSTGSAAVQGNYSIALGGIAGGSRAGNSKLTRCWSDMTLCADPVTQNSSRISYLGGIIGIVDGISASALPEISYCFALNPLLDGADADYTKAGRVVGYGEKFGNEGSYNFALDTMKLVHVTIADYDEDDSGYRSSWGRDITRQAACGETSYTNVLWNAKEIVDESGETDYEEVAIWDFSKADSYPQFVWQVSETPEPEGFAVTVDDRTGAAAQISLTGGTYTGELSFTVSCPSACVVLYTADGETYTALDARREGDAYRFRTEAAENMTLVVALKGDVDLNGSINGDDVALTRRFAARLEAPTQLQKLILGTESITGITALRLQRTAAGLYDQSW